MGTPDICPHCGAELPAKAAACPACGSDENTGWNDEYDDTAPMDDDEYADALRRAFGTEGRNGHLNFRSMTLGAVALGLVVIFILYYVL